MPSCRLLLVHPQLKQLPDLGSEGNFSLMVRLPGTVFPPFPVEWGLLSFLASCATFRDVSIPTSPLVVTVSGLYEVLRRVRASILGVHSMQ